MAKKAKRKAAPTWSDYIRSVWGVNGGCPTVGAARIWVGEQEAAGLTPQHIWRRALRYNENWCERVWSDRTGISVDMDTPAEDMHGELNNLWANYSGWSPAFKKAAVAEIKRLTKLADRQFKEEQGENWRRHTPTLVRVGNKVEARFSGAKR